MQTVHVQLLQHMVNRGTTHRRLSKDVGAAMDCTLLSWCL